jgi:predicted peptidase
MRQMCALLAMAVAAIGSGPPEPQAKEKPSQLVVGEFIARMHQTAAGTMPYRLYIPRNYTPQQRYPLILWLHGGGGSGNDNARQIAGDQVPGTRTWITPARQRDHPAFVLVPQTVGPLWADAHSPELGPELTKVIQILDAISSEFSTDPRRVYALGQSIGGSGVWSLISNAPERFAAAIILCPNPGDLTRASRAAQMPIWIFQGDGDGLRVEGSRALVAALRAAGGRPRYTEYPHVGHDIWTRVFAEPQIVPWLFAQRR